MSVISTIPEHFTQMYARNFMMKLQQSTSRLGNLVFRKNGSGESIRFSRLGVTEMDEITGRGGDTIPTDQDTEERWVRPRKFENHKRKDHFDDKFLGEVVLPESDFIKSQVAAVNRRVDRLIIEAATATAYEGETGTDAVTLPSSQQVGVQFGGTHNVGLTFGKVNETGRIFDENEVPEEGRVFVMSAQGKADLINDVLTNHSSDLASIKEIEAWQAGVGAFRGFQFVRTQLLALNDSDIRTSIAFQRDQIGLGVWLEIEHFIDRLPTKRHCLQVSTYMSHGATRIEELGVASIACDESP